jgi:hypothetical protein
LLGFEPIPEENALKFNLTNLKLNLRISDLYYSGLLIPLSGYADITASQVFL